MPHKKGKNKRKGHKLVIHNVLPRCHREEGNDSVTDEHNEGPTPNTDSHSLFWLVTLRERYN
jgi:hypothetical protein